MAQEPGSEPAAQEPSISREAQALRGLLWADLSSASTAALLGGGLMALVDLVATLWAAPGSLGMGTILRLALLEITLAVVLLLFLWPLCLGVAAASRLGYRFLDRDKGSRWQGLFGAARPHLSAGPLAAWLWALLIAATVYLGASTLLTIKVSAMFKEPQLTALVLAVLQLGLIAALGALAFLLYKGARWIGTKVDGILPEARRRFNPFGSAPAALLLMVAMAWPVLSILFKAMPQLAPLVPWRLIISFASFGLGCYLATLLLARRGGLWPQERKRRLIAVALSSLCLLFIVPSTLVHFGAHQDTKAAAISSSPTMSATMDLVRVATDFDGDGFGSLLGENDCGPFNKLIHPLARDIPDNGADENCDGKDFKLGKLPSYKTGERMPVPEAYLEDWNVLLITIDTVRYDHTSLAGYKRNTTPNLKEFAKRSASFTFANAPSAGTMASVPAILTSKFFHSGIALDENVPRGSPPILKPENTLISEVLKKEGYYTGAILTHEYFNNWGMEQGMDEYDNSIGKKRDPYGVTSVKLTDKAISWMGKRRDKKWFLWLHYLDPHGRYVSHPGEVSYGTSGEDIYDGELHFTDKHLGRLFDYLAHSPMGKKTIVLLTSDHGDGFNEHGYINHGQDLHRELLHVPLLVYVPNIEPREIPGAVSPIDLFPTIADLVGADIGELAIEGESLVPQLFYGKDARHRTVFAETNWPKPLRAAVNERYKLILNLQANVARLFDLKKDPWEKKNVWTKEKRAYEEMRGYLNEWLERVYYARDPESNQAMAKLQDHMVRDLPDNAKKVEGVVADETISVEGLELIKEGYKPGDQVPITVYFRALKDPDKDLKLQVEAWLSGGTGTVSRTAKSKLRFTADGLFATSRWHEGELVRDRFKLTLPPSWPVSEGSVVKLGIRFRERTNGKIPVTGTPRQGYPDLIEIGKLKLQPKTPATPPSPGTPGPALEKIEKRKLAPAPAPAK